MSSGQIGTKLRFLPGLFVVVVANAAMAISGEAPLSPDARFDDRTWPAPVIEAANAATPVYGMSSDRSGSHVLFRGRTQNLNAFLHTIATTKDAKLRVYLQEGAGSYQPPVLEGEAEPVVYNWMLSVYPTDSPPWEPDKDPTPVVSVEIYLHGDVELSELTLPLKCEAFVGGAIGNLVRRHNARRERGAAGDTTAVEGGRFGTESEDSPAGEPAEAAHE